MFYENNFRAAFLFFFVNSRTYFQMVYNAVFCSVAIISQKTIKELWWARTRVIWQAKHRSRKLLSALVYIYH